MSVPWDSSLFDDPKGFEAKQVMSFAPGEGLTTSIMEEEMDYRQLFHMKNGGTL